MTTKCKYCDTEHPEDQIANPHYCIARLGEQVERLEAALAEKDKEIVRLRENNLEFIDTIERLSIELKLERDRNKLTEAIIRENEELTKENMRQAKEIERLKTLLGVKG